MSAVVQNPGVRALTREELEAHWMTFTANRNFKAKPRMLSHAKGMHYWTPEGRQILDGVAGLWCVNAGHGRKEISEGVARSLEQMDFAPPFQMGHPQAFELANKIVKIAPKGMDHVFFVNSGSEAVETALKIALQYQRLRGEGPPKLGSPGKRGDIHYRFTIDVPKELTDEQRQMLEDLSGGGDVRAGPRAQIAGGTARKEPQEQHEPQRSDGGVHPADEEECHPLVANQPEQRAGNAGHAGRRTDLRVVAREGVESHGMPAYADTWTGGMAC